MVGKDAENFDPKEIMGHRGKAERAWSPEFEQRVAQIQEDRGLVEAFIGFMAGAQDAKELDYETWLAVGREHGWTSESPAPISRKDIDEHLDSIGESVLLMDGFDEAVIGLSQRINEPMLAVYSYFRMVRLLVQRDGMSIEEAEEYIDFNCVGAWMGERTPIITWSIPSYG